MLNQNSGAPFFTGLVIGGLVGVGATLLLAPQSGQATRDQIKDKSLELKDGAVEGFTEASHRAQVQAEVWQDKGQQMTGAINRSKDSIINAVSQSKESITNAVSQSKDRVIEAAN
jgi:gas vesicle protein